MLLALVVFGVGIIRSFFTPEKTRVILAGQRGCRRRHRSSQRRPARQNCATDAGVWAGRTLPEPVQQLAGRPLQLTTAQQMEVQVKH
jgi:hypothetical protein